MKRIIGVTVGTPISPTRIDEALKPVKTVNGVAPDARGNVEVKSEPYVLTEADKAGIVSEVIASLPVYNGEVVPQ